MSQVEGYGLSLKAASRPRLRPWTPQSHLGSTGKHLSLSLMGLFLHLGLDLEGLVHITGHSHVCIMFQLLPEEISNADFAGQMSSIEHSMHKET